MNLRVVAVIDALSSYGMHNQLHQPVWLTIGLRKFCVFSAACNCSEAEWLDADGSRQALNLLGRERPWPYDLALKRRRGRSEPY